MNRFLKTLSVLVVALFTLVSGVNATLDHLSRDASQASFTWYQPDDRLVYSYEGDLSRCAVYARKPVVYSIRLVHQANAPVPAVD